MKNITFIIYLSTLLGVQFVSPFGGIDVIGAQWLYLSIHSTIFLFYLSLKPSLVLDVNSFLKSRLVQLLLFFYVLVLLSIIQSDNYVESIFVCGRLFVIPLEVFISFSLYKDVQQKGMVIASIITAFLCYDLLLIFSEYIQMTSGIVEYSLLYAKNLKANTGNKNIAAAAIMIKIPFAMYFIYAVRNLPLKVLSVLLLCLASFSLVILSTRSMLLALFLVCLSYFFIAIYQNGILQKKVLIILPLITPLLVGEIYFSDKEALTVSSELESVINYQASSSATERLRFYKQGIQQILKTPLLGIGIGNWKIKSIDYDAENMKGYIVPYNTHNDFIEMAVELGLLGMLSYLFIFIFIFGQSIKKILRKQLSHYSLIATLSVGVYFIDASLNFPMQRCIMTVMFITLFSIFTFIELYPSHEK